MKVLQKKIKKVSPEQYREDIAKIGQLVFSAREIREKSAMVACSSRDGGVKKQKND